MTVCEIADFPGRRLQICDPSHGRPRLIGAYDSIVYLTSHDACPDHGPAIAIDRCVRVGITPPAL